VKFQPDTFGKHNAVSRYQTGEVQLQGQTYRSPIIVPWQGPITAWLVAGFDVLTREHFAAIAALSPEVVIFGSGPKLRFPKPELVTPLIERRIGLETMDNAAACRTYNVLVSEGRRVVLGLLVG
jgi:uncharacterized protein